MTIAATYTVGDHVLVGDGTPDNSSAATVTDTDEAQDLYQLDFDDTALTDGLWYSRLGSTEGTGIHEASGTVSS